MPLTITGALTNTISHSNNATQLFNTNLRVSDSNLMNSGAIVQTVYKKVDNMSAWTAPVSSNTIVSDMNISITPKYSTSKILITFMVSFEMHQDTVFRLGRNNVEIVRNNTDGNFWSGWVHPGYDQDTASTPRTNYYIWVDSPATTALTTYNLLISSSNNVTAYTLFLNRNANGNGSDANEVGISYAMLQEIL